MLVTKLEAEHRFNKMLDKKNLVGVTLSQTGILQSWKEDTLEFCNYLLYSNGALLYRKGSTFHSSNAALGNSRSINFAGSHTLLAETEYGKYHYFGKKSPLSDEYSLVMAFRHNETIILIVADARFSRLPEYFEFPATTSAENICLRTVHHVVASRDRFSAERMNQWLNGVRHPLGKFSKMAHHCEPVEQSASEIHGEETPVAHSQESSPPQLADEPNLFPCV